MSKKSSTSTEPSKFAKGYISQGANTLQDTYGANAGQIQSATDQVVGLLPSMVEKYQAGNPAVNAATGYTSDVLGGKYLDGNPYLDGVISASNDDLRNQMQAALGAKGLTGGSDYADIISKNIARNTMDMRYADYGRERGMMESAAGRAPGLAAADAIQVTPMLAALGASTTPVQAAGAYAGGMGGLLGQYGTQSGKPSQWDGFKDVLGTGLSIASMFSDARLKTDVTAVGKTDGGLPIYSYRYGGEGPFHMGVMAQDVREAQPDALGPEIDGYMTVNYGKVR